MLLPTEQLLALRAIELMPRGPGGNITTTLHVPATQPEWAQPLSPQIGAFSIEMDHWQDWAGETVGAPNAFVNKALAHFSERTGQPVYFRVGANSEDRSLLNLSVPVMHGIYPEATADVPAPEAENIEIGRDMYALSDNLPAGTWFQWGVNLKVLNETETLAQVAHLSDSWKRVKKNKLKTLEFGNEANVFSGWGVTAKSGWEDWNAWNYTQTWKNLAIKAKTLVDYKKTDLVPGSWVVKPYEWSVGTAMEAGLLDDKDVRKATREWSSHSYSGAFTADVPIHVGTLMDKNNVRGNLSIHWNDIRIARSQNLGYYLSETNSYGSHGIPGLSNGGEQVMWAVDHMLQGAVMGISRMHFHNGRGFKYNVLQPVTLAGTGVDDGVGADLQSRPHIQALYYAFLISFEAVGKRASYISEVATDSGTLVAYAVFEMKKLARLVVLNSDVHLGDGPRNTAKIALPNLSGRGKATVKRFHTKYTNSTSGFTWAGQNFDTPDTTPTGALTTETVEGGVLEVEASSVVLVEFK